MSDQLSQLVVLHLAAGDGIKLTAWGLSKLSHTRELHFWCLFQHVESAVIQKSVASVGSSSLKAATIIEGCVSVFAPF